MAESEDERPGLVAEVWETDEDGNRVRLIETVENVGVMLRSEEEIAAWIASRVEETRRNDARD